MEKEGSRAGFHGSQSESRIRTLNCDEAGRERVRKDSVRVEVKRKLLGESERCFMSEGEKEHLVRRYPGNVRSSF
jgi:hypothetical protein